MGELFLAFWTPEHRRTEDVQVAEEFHHDPVETRCHPWSARKHVLLSSEALKTFSARQIRLLFVLQPWNRPMAYGESSREEVKSKESALKNFFQNVSVAVRDTEPSMRSMKWEVDPPPLTESHSSLCVWT